jgi:WD40 repeat protein
MSESSASESATQNKTAPIMDEKYRCGTLQYTKLGLFSLFGWMIMANLCFGLFEGNGGAGSIPFYLQDNFHISNTMVSILFNFIPMIIGTFMTPIVSFWSDRTRTRMGRRIPYILFSAPLLVLFAIALGFSDDIIAFCKVQFATSPTIAPLGAALFIIGFLTIGWSFFNEFVGTVYFYLLPDVMPRHFLGRFQGVSSVAGTLLSIAMNTWVNPHQLTHIKAIHVGVAILYFVGFGLVCWRVKEGKYPPVEDVSEETTFMDKVRLYFKECFNHPMYIMIYMVTAVAVLTRGLSPAGVFGLHLSQHQSKIVAHANVSDAMATTPDNAWMVSGGQDGLVKVFQGPGLAFKEISSVCRAGGDADTCLAVSQNGELTAIGRTNGTIEVWDVAKNQCVQTLGGHTGTVTCLAFSGAQLVSAGADQTIRFWDARAGKCCKVISKVSNVHALAMTPSGKVLVTAVGKNTVHCWDVAKARIAKSFVCGTDCAQGVSVSQDGKTVASCSSDGTMEVWDVLESPVLKHRIKPEGKVRVFSLSADARSLMGCCDQRMLAWDVATEANIATFTLPANDMSMSGMTPDGKQVVFASPDGQVHVCQQPGKTFKFTRILSRQGDSISSLALTHSGRLVAVGATNGSVEIWNPAKDELVRTLNAHAGAVTCLAFPREGAWLASAGTDKTIKLWDSSTGALVKSLPVGDDVKTLAMTSDGKWLASGSGKGSIQCWDLASGTVIKNFSGNGSGMDGLAFSEDGKTLASHSAGGPIEVWAVADECRLHQKWWSGIVRAVTFDLAGKDRLNHFKFDADVKAINLAANGAEVSACSDRSLKCWNLVANRPSNLFSMQSASTSIAMTPDGKRLVSGGKDGTLTFWDNTNIKKPVLIKTFKPRSGAPLTVDISADGRTVVSGSLSGMIDLWDASNGQCMLTLTGHTAFVRSVAFSPDGTRLVSASADKTAKIWDVKSGACLQTLKGHDDEVDCAAFSSKGDRIVSGGNDQKIIVWDAAQGTILKILEGSPGPVYAVCFAPAIGPVPAAERVKQGWFVAALRNTGDFLKNVFVNESMFSDPPDQSSKILGEDRWVISGGRDGETDEVNSGVRIWDIKQGSLIPEVEDLKNKALKGHKKAIVSVAYKPDIRVILSASADESIRIWKPLDLTKEITKKADDQSFRTFSGYTHGVTGMSIQKAGKLMVNASEDGTLHAWDIDQGISLEKGNRYANNFFAIIALLLAYPLGALVDRLNPIKIVLWTTFLGLPTTLVYYFFYHDYMSSLWVNLAMMPINMLGGMAALPMMVMLYPKTKYGQFCSANAMVKQCVGAFAGIFGALLMDQMTAGSYDTDNYRYGYLFKFAANVISFLFLLGVFLYWRKMGGEKGYVAPEADGKHLERAQAEAAKKA